MEKGTSAAGDLRGKWCGWWDLPCSEIDREEVDRCKAEGLFCCPDECEFCMTGYAAAEAAAEAEA